MLAITAIIGWFGRLSALWATFSVANVIGGVAVSQTVEAGLRWLRAAVIVGILMFVLGQFVPAPVSSFTNLWATYSGSLGPVGSYIGYFVPMGLLTTLLDLYVLMVMALVVFSSVSRVVEFSK